MLKPRNNGADVQRAGQKHQQIEEGSSDDIKVNTMALSLMGRGTKQFQILEF